MPSVWCNEITIRTRGRVVERSTDLWSRWPHRITWRTKSDRDEIPVCYQSSSAAIGRGATGPVTRQLQEIELLPSPWFLAIYVCSKSHVVIGGCTVRALCQCKVTVNWTKFDTPLTRQQSRTARKQSEQLTHVLGTDAIVEQPCRQCIFSGKWNCLIIFCQINE